VELYKASEHPGAWRAVTDRSDVADDRSLGRWIAIDDEPLGAAEAWIRPDDRVFLRVQTTHADVARRLVLHARESLARPVHVVCREGRIPGRRDLLDIGSEIVLAEDSFVIPFEKAREAVERSWTPSGNEIVSVSEIDTDRLFELDITLRRLVPGTEGWMGDRPMFDGEMEEAPPFDPSAYLVGRNERTGSLLGLIRFWRNESGPRLGLVAVARSHRSTTLGPALIKHGLRAASQWGWSHFEASTARSNRHLHHRLERLGAERTGSLEIMRR
jgi:GNAT superfamily N-acetyltransferase